MSAAQKHQLEIWERHADLVLRPEVQSLAWDDFDRADEAIEAGAAVDTPCFTADSQISVTSRTSVNRRLATRSTKRIRC